MPDKLFKRWSLLWKLEEEYIRSFFMWISGEIAANMRRSTQNETPSSREESFDHLEEYLVSLRTEVIQLEITRLNPFHLAQLKTEIKRLERIRRQPKREDAPE